MLTPLERPLTIGDVRVMFMTRSQVDYPGFYSLYCVVVLASSTRMGVEACRLPGMEATRPLCVLSGIRNETMSGSKMIFFHESIGSAYRFHNSHTDSTYWFLTHRFRGSQGLKGAGRVGAGAGCACGVRAVLLCAFGPIARSGPR